MSDHRLEWSPEPRNVDPEIIAAVDTVEARLVGFDGFGAAIHEQVFPEDIAAIHTFTPERIDELGGMPADIPHFTIPVDADDRPLTPIISARDCELAGFDLADVIAAYRELAR